MGLFDFLKKAKNNKEIENMELMDSSSKIEVKREEEEQANVESQVESKSESQTEATQEATPKSKSGKKGKRKTLVKEFDELVKEGNTKNLKAVFEKCDINAYGGYNKGNALSFALSEEMMQWLVEQGADIEYKDQFGNTPLNYHAGRGRDASQVASLIALGANVNTADHQKRTPLHFAVASGILEKVECLVNAGADVHAKDDMGHTPLEAALFQNGINIRALSLIAEYLFQHGVGITERTQKYMIQCGEAIEFRRADINPDMIDEIDEALGKMYALFQVEPVPRRVLYDGKSRIVVKETRWQKQHEELWNLLVPGSGHANTVQGEVIRISGKVSYEILDNGSMNWDSDYKQLVNAWEDYIHMGNPLSEEQYKDAENVLKVIVKGDGDDEELNRMAELSVNWIVQNLDAMPVGDVKYRR